MHKAVAARYAEQEQLIARARNYVARLSKRLDVLAAVVAGSVARGDFNVWSDIDVVVVAEDLPERAVDRIGLLLEDSPGRVQPFGYTPEELAAEHRRGNVLVRSALSEGVIITGDELLARLRVA